MHFTIRKGLDLPVTGAPEQRIEDAPTVTTVAIPAADYRGVRPKLSVDVGTRVRLGQTLFTDRHRPDIRFTSPGCGEVIAIERGARRALAAVVVRLDGDDAESFQSWSRERLAGLDRDVVRKNLLVAGLWPALRERPFSRIPAPDGTPHSIFVTAMDTNPLAADPRVIIDECPQDFVDGLAVIGHLTDGPVFVCQAPGDPLPTPEDDKFVPAVFAGPHPAGLPGTHIHKLDPVGDSKTVWHLNYQDVIAAGRLFTGGRLSPERVVAVGGPSVKKPRLLRTRFGASTRELLENELTDEEVRVLSGSVLSGRRAAGKARYLGAYHLQLSVLPEGRDREFLAWMMPGMKRFSAVRAYLSGWLPKRLFPLTTSQNGSPRAMVPIGNFEKVMPLDILPAPLLKALLVQDSDTARALGCLELDEEDLALCSFVCCSKYEYGPALRENLDVIERDG